MKQWIHQLSYLTVFLNWIFKKINKRQKDWEKEKKDFELFENAFSHLKKAELEKWNNGRKLPAQVNIFRFGKHLENADTGKNCCVYKCVRLYAMYERTPGTYATIFEFIAKMKCYVGHSIVTVLFMMVVAGWLAGHSCAQFYTQNNNYALFIIIIWSHLCWNEKCFSNILFQFCKRNLHNYRMWPREWKFWFLFVMYVFYRPLFLLLLLSEHLLTHRKWFISQWKWYFMIFELHSFALARQTYQNHITNVKRRKISRRNKTIIFFRCIYFWIWIQVVLIHSFPMANAQNEITFRIMPLHGIYLWFRLCNGNFCAMKTNAHTHNIWPNRILCQLQPCIEISKL